MRRSGRCVHFWWSEIKRVALDNCSPKVTVKGMHVRVFKDIRGGLARHPGGQFTDNTAQQQHGLKRTSSTGRTPSYLFISLYIHVL